MIRNRKTAKDAGTRFETLVADYLRAHVDDRIERRRLSGKDRGDIGGVRTPHGGRVVIECKDYGGQIKASEWLREAGTERGNDSALVGVVAAKRRGTASPGDQFVLMEMRDFVALLTGERPDEA